MTEMSPFNQDPNPVPGDPSRSAAVDVKTQPSSTGTTLGSTLTELLQTVLLALVLYFLIDSVVARVRVENISMLPTLQPGEFILVNKLAYRFGNVERGDIVVFHNPTNPVEDYIKRVIGVPGDTIVVGEGEVKVNGYVLNEDYLSAPPGYSGEWQVPADSLFVLGDNRNQSLDSHSWGYVPQRNVVGRALVIYWPFDKVRVLNHPRMVEAAQ